MISLYKTYIDFQVSPEAEIHFLGDSLQLELFRVSWKHFPKLRHPGEGRDDAFYQARF
jgi:hypothetical protein